MSTVGPMMTLNYEPTDAVVSRELDLDSKSYADAVQEALDADDTPIDEDAIKESPPRPRLHFRNTSEPRAFGEIMDEVDRTPSPGSPRLRHPKGRLENKASQESYAQVVREHPPGQDGLPNGDGYGMPIQDLQNEHQKHVNGDHASDTLNGVGEDGSPRVPTRKGHVRFPSRSSRSSRSSADATSPKFAQENLDIDGEDRPADSKLEPGKVVYEEYQNGSGENLVSIQPDEGYHASLEQRQDKLPDSKSADARTRKNSELVSGRHAGAGWFRSAIRWAPLHVPLERRLQTFAVLFHTLSIVSCAAFFFGLCAIPLFWPILLPYLVYILLSRAYVDGELAHRSEWLRSSKIWSLFASYYPARLHRTHVLEPTRKYIFGYHPHGIISHGAFAAFATEALGFAQLFPGITNTLLTLDANFRIPLYRDFALRMGLASVSRESCENLLSKGGPTGEGMGRAITIVVGGARESLDATPYTVRLVLKRRKGFVKLAIRTGADLVPVFGFGENDLYDQFDGNSHPHIHRLQLLVKKIAGFTVPLFHARGVFNYDVGLMPYRRPVNIVVGKPIPIMQSKNPDPAYVEEIHSKYVEELTRIWDDWKDTFAKQSKGELEIIE